MTYQEDTGAAMPLPQWKCHKVVSAAKIVGIDHGAEQYRLGLDTRCNDTEGGYVVVGAAWFDKHQPELGGYLVVYQDGYRSYSPAQAFEEGYTRLP